MWAYHFTIAGQCRIILITGCLHLCLNSLMSGFCESGVNIYCSDQTKGRDTSVYVTQLLLTANPCKSLLDEGPSFLDTNLVSRQLGKIGIMDCISGSNPRTVLRNRCAARRCQVFRRESCSSFPKLNNLFQFCTIYIYKQGFSSLLPIKNLNNLANYY